MPAKRVANVFTPFIDETMERFKYLVRDFGFEHSETSVVSYECSITFRKNGRVAVTAMWEAGALPWVMLSGRFGKRTEEAALDFVIERRCPDRKVEASDKFPVSDEVVLTLIRSYATALRECAVDFLEGDPSVLREIKPAVDAAYKVRTREMKEEEKQASAARKKRARK